MIFKGTRRAGPNKSKCREMRQEIVPLPPAGENKAPFAELPYHRQRQTSLICVVILKTIYLHCYITYLDFYKLVVFRERDIL